MMLWLGLIIITIGYYLTCLLSQNGDHRKQFKKILNLQAYFGAKKSNMRLCLKYILQIIELTVL